MCKQRRATGSEIQAGGVDVFQSFTAIPQAHILHTRWHSLEDNQPRCSLLKPVVGLCPGQLTSNCKHCPLPRGCG